MTRPSASASPPPPQLGLWARLTRALRWRFGVYRPTDVNGWSDGDVLSLAEDLLRRKNARGAARILEAFALRITGDPRVLQRYADLSRALGAHETAVIASLQTAELYAQQGLMQKAAAVLTQLVRAYPAQLDARLGLARALEALDRKKEAAANYAVVLQALEQQGRVDEAAPFAQKITELWPQARADYSSLPPGRPSAPPAPSGLVAPSAPPAPSGLVAPSASSPSASSPSASSVGVPARGLHAAPSSRSGVARPTPTPAPIMPVVPMTPAAAPAERRASAALPPSIASNPSLALGRASPLDDDDPLSLPDLGAIADAGTDDGLLGERALESVPVVPPSPTVAFKPGALLPPNGVSLIFGRPITASGDRPAIHHTDEVAPLDLGALPREHPDSPATMALPALRLNELLAESKVYEELSDEEIADRELALQVQREYEERLRAEREAGDAEEPRGANDDVATVFGMSAITDEDKRRAGIPADPTIGLRIPDYRSVVIDFDAEGGDGPKRR
jgi:tetratricopeptide (TPR) repeat protein